MPPSRPYRCCACGHSTREFTDDMIMKAANERVCKDCVKAGARITHPEARMDSIQHVKPHANHAPAYETAVPHRCVFCGHSSRAFSREMESCAASERICNDCVARGARGNQPPPNPEGRPQVAHRAHPAHHTAHEIAEAERKAAANVARGANEVRDHNNDDADNDNCTPTAKSRLNHQADFEDLHEASQAIYRNYRCMACGIASMDFRMAVICGDPDKRRCMKCEEDDVPVGAIEQYYHEHEHDGEVTSPLGGTLPYQLHRSARQKMCTRCGTSTRAFSVEMDQGDPATRVCLDCEAEIAAELDAEDAQQEQQQHQQEQQQLQQQRPYVPEQQQERHQQQLQREVTPPRRGYSPPRYDRVSPARSGGGSLTAAGCIKRAMRCAKCKQATKNYTIESLKLDAAQRICIGCLQKE